MQFYADTVKKMAYCHFVSGSPLRTLCLLIAGQQADVFNAEDPVDSNYGTLHRQQQPAGVMHKYLFIAFLPMIASNNMIYVQ